MGSAVEVFFSYSRKDEGLRDELQSHLSLLRHQGLIHAWHDREIGVGEDWAGAIDAKLESAGVVLLLVSADYMASRYCYALEMQRALARHAAGDALIIPVIVRDCDWQHAPFAKLQVAPRDGRPVTSWPNRDEAWRDVVSAIRSALVNRHPTTAPRTAGPGRAREGLLRWRDRLDAHFAGHARVLSVPASAPQLFDAGPFEPPAEVAARAEEDRSKLEINDPHGILEMPVDWTVEPTLLRYKSTDFAVVQALREAEKRPAVLSACAVIVDPKDRILYLHRRARGSATYGEGGRLHTFGGAFQPVAGKVPGDRSLERTMLREVHEESDKWLSRQPWPVIMVEEVPTGFVQCVFLGVSTTETDRYENFEGSTERVDFRWIEDHLLLAGNHWVPSGKLHVLAWLAAGCPGCPDATFGKRSAEELLSLALAQTPQDYA